jgi:hypothetical protein
LFGRSSGFAIAAFDAILPFLRVGVLSRRILKTASSFQPSASSFIPVSLESPPAQSKKLKAES